MVCKLFCRRLCGQESRRFHHARTALCASWSKDGYRKFPAGRQACPDEPALLTHVWVRVGRGWGSEEPRGLSYYTRQCPRSRLHTYFTTVEGIIPTTLIWQQASQLIANSEDRVQASNDSIADLLRRSIATRLNALLGSLTPLTRKPYT